MIDWENMEGKVISTTTNVQAIRWAKFVLLKMLGKDYLYEDIRLPIMVDKKLGRMKNIKFDLVDHVWAPFRVVIVSK